LFAAQLRGDYVGCAWAFFALANFKADALAFIEGCEARNLYFRVMDEQICAAIVWGNKTVTFT